MTLMYREYYAMKLVVDAKELQDCPDAVQAIELKDDQIDTLVKRNGPGRISLDRNGILSLPDYGDVKI